MEDKSNQMTQDFNEFVKLVTGLKNQMDKIKSNRDYNRIDITEAAKQTGRIRYLRQAAKELIDFVEFPEKTRDIGRPVKFPDSQEEKELFTKYVKEGLSIRKIAQITGLSKDMVNTKLKRYMIKKD